MTLRRSSWKGAVPGATFVPRLRGGFAVVGLLGSIALSPARLLALPSWAASASRMVACDTLVGASTLRPACVLRALRIERADEVPELDGRLTEAVWQRAAVATGFQQFEPVPGALATERTEARVVLADDALYVGLRLFDSKPDSVRAQFVRRDDSEAVSDWAHVFIDSYRDRRTAFQFSTTPRGTRVDVLRSGDTGTDPAWDAVWDVETSIDAEGWTAEFRIPLSQLRYSGDGSGGWGINFGREIARRGEVSYWTAISPTTNRFVSQFGELVGLEGLRATRRLEVLPYSLGRLAREPGTRSNPFYRPNETWSSAGLDLKLGLTSDLTLTATVNPDFGQVEADPSVVNLSAFEQFYPERRPFFTEGAEIFRFQLVPEGYAFYSRRIGRAPQVAARPPAGGYVDAPATAPILAALKVSGKTRSGWSLGLLGAVTGRVDALVADSLGAKSVQVVEPLTSYGAARLSRDFRGGRSGIGGIATYTRRSLDDDRLSGLRTSALAIGADWFHRFGRDAFEFTGWVLGSDVSGSTAAMSATQRSAVHYFQRPDADHLTFDSTLTSLSGLAGEVFLRRISGSWTWSLGGGWRTPGLDVNDVGFVSYTDTRYVTAIARYRVVRPGRYLRSWFVEGQLVRASSFGGEVLRPSGHLVTSWQFRNFWGATVNVDHWASHTWPWELRGGPGLRRSGYTNVRATLGSDTRRWWRVNLRTRMQADADHDGRLWTLDPTLDLRPTARATISLGPVVTHNHQPAQYVTTATSTDGSRAYLLGLLDQTTTALSARVSYAFSPTLAVDVYAQPFLSGGAYAAFRRVERPRAREFDERAPVLAPGSISLSPTTDRYGVDADQDGTAEYTFRNPDFNVRELRTNTVVRWEYRPGSTLFVVWAQTRDDDLVSPYATGRDMDRLFAAPPTNVLMVKLNYWVDF